MPVFALYNFDDTSSEVSDSATGNGAQDGVYLNGAAAAGGQLVLDGCDDFAKIYADPEFQLPRGTLDITFTTGSFAGTGPQTVLARDSVGENAGSFRLQVFPDGSAVVTHESDGASQTYSTGPGFFGQGDTISFSYSWDAAGTGGALVMNNTTSGESYVADVPPGLTMDMGDQNQPWTVGAGQARSDADLLTNIDQHFAGTVQVFSLSDTVDTAAGRDGIVRGTGGNDLIDLAYVDPFDADRIDANDAIIPGDGPNDDRVEAGAGNDTVLAGVGDDTVNAGAGNDSVRGEAGNDDLRGGEGRDTLVGGDGRDLVSGQQGDDLIDTSGSGGALPDIDYPGFYPADTDPLNDLDTVYGGSGNDTIRTGDDADLVFGGDGRDDINGGIDNDTLYGGRSSDTITGGEGADLIDGGSGNDLLYGGLGPEFPDAINIEDDRGDLRPNNGNDLILAGDGNDTVYGLDDADTISGGTGNDLLFGGIDRDQVTGDAGNDRIHGGEGADTLTGGDDRDTFFVGTQDDGAGDSIDGSEGGNDFDTLDLRGSGPLSVTFAADNPENGRVDFRDADGNVTSTLNFINIENVIPCFTPGTLIATPKGEVPVEHLQVGDKVITRDNGIQEIRWLGAKALTWQDFRLNPHLRPVLVKRGSLGNELPEQDMVVSPNHRLLVANDRTALYFDEHEVLVAAKHLAGNDGVHAVDSIGITYLHFMFDRHEVVLSNGAWTESFQPGDYTLKGMGNAQRSEIYELFPELKSGEGIEAYTAARRTLKRHEARLLVR